LTESPSEGETALSLATKIANPAVVQFLLLTNADPNISDASFMSPLSSFLKRLAKLKSQGIYGSLTSIANAFLDAGAEVNPRHHPPLTYACRLMHVDLVNLLLAAGADLKDVVRYDHLVFFSEFYLTIDFSLNFQKRFKLSAITLADVSEFQSI
jgi:ankyrin repeat protein